jgi:hypothetical protein
VDHCDFEQAYDGMVDIKGGSDYVTVSWCVFRTQQKCSLVGASDNSGDVDRGHLNVTFHHNWYQDVAERLPRMRFGNAHVFNLYCVNLGGKGIQSTAGAATLVENAYFLRPQSDSYPTIEANGGPTGAVKVVNSTIVNLPGVRVAFREYGAADFRFNPPFLTNRPPYSYTLDSVAEVPGLVTNFAGLGKIGFELWQGEQFSAAEQANAAVSAPNAAPAGDGVPNLVKYALGLPPWTRVTGPLTTFRLEQGQGVLTYTRPATATDVAYQVQVSTNLAAWTSEAVEEQCVGTHPAGLQIWEARLTGPPPSQLLFRLRLTR